MDKYGLFKAVLKWPLRLLYRVKVTGAENEPSDPFIVCANHSAFCDPILVTVALKSRPRWIAKKELKKNLFMRFVFYMTDAIPIAREGFDTAALHQSINAIKEGTSVGIFPQGTRMRRVEPEPSQAHAGLALIASMSEATVLPVSIVTKRRQPGMFRRTEVIIHKPVPYSEYSAICDHPSKKDITEYIFTRVCEPFRESGTKK